MLADNVDQEAMPNMGSCLIKSPVCKLSSHVKDGRCTLYSINAIIAVAGIMAITNALPTWYAD